MKMEEKAYSIDEDGRKSVESIQGEASEIDNKIILLKLEKEAAIRQEKRDEQRRIAMEERLAIEDEEILEKRNERERRQAI